VHRKEIRLVSRALSTWIEHRCGEFVRSGHSCPRRWDARRPDQRASAHQARVTKPQRAVRAMGWEGFLPQLRNDLPNSNYPRVQVQGLWQEIYRQWWEGSCCRKVSFTSRVAPSGMVPRGRL